MSEIVVCQPALLERARKVMDATEPSWPRPIPVSERLPDLGVRVLFWSFDEWYSGNLTGGENTPYFFVADGEGFGAAGVTHWLPLPPKPTE
jgi:hypothetical protein